MKRQRLRIRMLAFLIFALFGALAVFGTYSVLTYGNRWFAYSRNPRVLAQKEQVTPGAILDAEGTVLAYTDGEGVRHYAEDAAARRALVHVLGDGRGLVSNGVESFQISYLYGFQASLPELVMGLLSGEARAGDTVQLTVSAPLTTALAGFFGSHASTRGKNGAAVIMNWKTGAVTALTSLPAFDPENVTGEDRASGAQPFRNRATQFLYPPGSVFMTVTAAAALAQLPRAEEVSLYCGGEALAVGDRVLPGEDGDAHGAVDLRTGLIRNCARMYATLAVNLGAPALQRTAGSFGFGENFLFRDLVVENSVCPGDVRDDGELAAFGLGLSPVAATPLHLCMVASGVANGGVMMEPRLLQRVVSAAGVERLAFTPAEYRACADPAAAALLGQAMRGAVTGGTAWRAYVPGLPVCGQTGTAALPDGTLCGWFVGYVDDEAMPFAIAVVVEGLDSGDTGGSTAALIAHDAFLWMQSRTPEEAPPSENRETKE